MLNNTNNSPLFYEYYAQWVDVYKKGAIREATMAKYLMTQKWIQKLAPELKVSELTRTAYQQILNDYAKEHERQTTLDFHHQLKGAILDALDEGMIERDPTRKAIIKGFGTYMMDTLVSKANRQQGADMVAVLMNCIINTTKNYWQFKKMGWTNDIHLLNVRYLLNRLDTETLNTETLDTGTLDTGTDEEKDSETVNV